MANRDNAKNVISWLLAGDCSIQFQVYRDLLDETKYELQKRIENEGWGLSYLNQRKTNFHWGQGFYQPKWISSHYTLLDLKNLNIHPDNEQITETINHVIINNKAEDGGIKLGPSTTFHSDVCVNGMFLNYASYFQIDEIRLKPIIDSILNELMPDGGFNCISIRNGAKHSSLHSTISVLEGLYEFVKNNYSYRIGEIQNIMESAEEFILIHNLYKSDKTGNIINKEFIKLHYPARWKYDILRALDYFQYSGKKYDYRMNAALDIIKNKRQKDGTWKLNAGYPGQVHFQMETAGKSSRWNTLRALRILKFYGIQY